MVPWLEGMKPCFSEHIERAWEDRSLIRMMSNESPISPQKARSLNSLLNRLKDM